LNFAGRFDGNHIRQSFEHGKGKIMESSYPQKVLLISNRVMHYRVSLYNYFHKRFRECGWEFIAMSDELQKENPYPLDFDFKVEPFRFWKYKKEIERIQPQAVILFLHLRDVIIWPLLVWLKMKNIPVIFWTKGANLDAPEDKVSLALYRFMHWSVDRLIFYSEKELELINEKHRHKVSIANNTINFNDFPEIKQSKEEIKKELGLKFDKIVLSVGRMGDKNQRKKVNHLIEIFKDINVDGLGLVIVGSGLQDQVQQNMNRDNTVYLGQVHDPENVKISKIFKMADVFCVPGHIGLGINQAFYFELPVVTESGGQPPEINYLINDRNGFLVSENNLDELKKKILYLVENEDIRSKFGKNAKNDILEYGSVENMFSGFLDCVNSLFPELSNDPFPKMSEEKALSGGKQ
jgi:glycosyltransferase involved in cell wall biosynthesis